MADGTTYVGLDVHKRDIQVATLSGLAKTPTRWQIPISRRRCAD
jgi:hypothetical protein